MTTTALIPSYSRRFGWLRLAPGLLVVSAMLTGWCAPIAAQGTSPAQREVNASHWPGHQGEVSIAVDRYRPERLVAASMDLEDGRILVMASSDRGVTWSRSQIQKSADAAYYADPMVAFDIEGRVYLAIIPVSSNNDPIGIEVSRSLDGGSTWEPTQRISENFDLDDKLIVTVDDDPESPYRDSIYVAWKWPPGGMYFSASRDHGQSFSRPRRIDSNRVSGLDLAVDRRGNLYLAANDQPQHSIRVLVSRNGGETFGPSIEVAQVRAGWYTSQPSHCQRMSLVHASITADLSDLSENLYVTWSDYAQGVDVSRCGDTCNSVGPCQTDVFLSRSSDLGLSWSAPIVVHEIDLGHHDQFFSWTRTDPRDGVVYVAFKGTRFSEDRAGTDVFLSRSSDCGGTWESSIRLSSQTSFATSTGFQYGDYQGVAVSDGNVYVAWTDYRRAGLGDADLASEIYVGHASFDALPTSGRCRP